ncbi:hypothetical protein D9615_004844 [Tricholomella constricta]|uniref:Mob1/phocein n=1 Tax=Tricholomella constricta TaxID=117010 RepID=A0A8H5HGS3_9AGAR|nr:hypothetical protein D9615_004844 [Tricholomella constricta]
MPVLPQRPLRGSRISSFYPVKSLPSLSSLDSAFQLQEYISLLIRLDVHDVDAIVSLPGKAAGKEKEKGAESDDTGRDKDKDKETDTVDNTGEESEGKVKNEITVDEACWIYEQIRRLAQDLTHPLITMLQQECTRASCPEMKAGEWLYLCVAHGNEGAMEQCCAIDYILHTLDSATALLNTSRVFPSRLQIPQSSHRHFSSLARRLGRIFAHAYFHHREAFEQAEAESSLYARFLALTSKFDLVPLEFLVIPPRSTEHEHDDRANHRDRDFDVQPPRLLAAAVDPRAAYEDVNVPGARQQQQQPNIAAPYPGQWERRGSVVPLVVTERAKSDSPPGLGNGSESPRKTGRSRTDTMVLHEAFVVAEELAKVDRAEAAEVAAVEQAVKEPSTTGGRPMPVSIEVPEMPDELLSPTEDFPKTAKPRADTLEEPQHTDNSLPESPIIKSPGAPLTSSLPEDATEAAAAESETQEVDSQEEEPVAAAAAAEPVLEPEAVSTSTSASTSAPIESETPATPAADEAAPAAEATSLEIDISEVLTAAAVPLPAPEATAPAPMKATETQQSLEEVKVAVVPTSEIETKEEVETEWEEVKTEEASSIEADVVVTAIGADTDKVEAEEKEPPVEEAPSTTTAEETVEALKETVEVPKEAVEVPKEAVEVPKEAVEVPKEAVEPKETVEAPKETVEVPKEIEVKAEVEAPVEVASEEKAAEPKETTVAAELEAEPAAAQG